jgi:ribosomal protein S18 acetylase RimI-like enzyme
MASMSMSLSASISPTETNSVQRDPSCDDDPTKIEISYRTAKVKDLTAIARLLYSVFEEDENGGGQGGLENATTKANGSDADDNKKFMWDTLTEKSSEPKLSPEQQLKIIKGQLAKRMVDATKEGSLPHSFLVATIPSSGTNGSIVEQGEDRVIGFLEMGTLPPPIPNSPISKVEIPYIGNLAVSNDLRRRNIGSTLVRNASQIANKWCAPSSETKSLPPFVFLSVERDNHEALKFYQRLGFEELQTAKNSTEKIYLAQELD